MGWNGIGGAPFYVINTAAKTLRLPDLRGMYIESAGFDSLGVGDSQGDGSRDIIGDLAGKACISWMRINYYQNENFLCAST